MRFTYFLIGILCLLCLFNHGNTNLDAQQATSIEIEVSDLDDYWRPNADTNLTFNISVTVPGFFTNGTLNAVLQNVTNYAGKSGNVPDSADHVIGEMTLAADLRLYETTGWSGSESQLSYTLNATTTQTMSLQVDCRDYAAYGELILTASGSGSTSNTVTIKIPKDDNGNKIADGWRSDGTMNYVQSDDIDLGINSNIGDNITVIDEYRGLNVNGSWTDTDPNGWDLFIRTDDIGIGNASSALPMTAHDMSETEVSWESGRVYSFGIGSSNVYAIRLADDPGSLCNGSLAFGCMPKAPTGSHSKGWIDSVLIENYIMAISSAGILVSKSGLENAIITHEIGHAVNLSHCPDIDCPNCYMWTPGDWPMEYVSQYAAHHNSDYDLIYDGNDISGGAYGSGPDRGYSSDRGVHIRQVEDVNGDGVINILDLTIVAEYIVNPKAYVGGLADVNDDNSINISDLMQVAQEFGNKATEFPHLPEDINGDKVVNILDITLVASNIGQSGATHDGDVNCDGTVDILDLVRVAAAFGFTVATP